MMAAGGLIAALGFALRRTVALHGSDAAGARARSSCRFIIWLALCALGLGLAFLVVVLPPSFAGLALMVSLPLPGVGPEALPRFSAGLLIEGWLWRSAVLDSSWASARSRSCAAWCRRAESSTSAWFPWWSRAWRWPRWPALWSRCCRAVWGCARACSWSRSVRRSGDDLAVVAALALAAGLGGRRAARRGGAFRWVPGFARGRQILQKQVRVRHDQRRRPRL